MKSLLFICLMFIVLSSQAQVAINTDGTNPDNSAMLDVKSTTKGLLAPRMTLAQRNAIVSPATGLLVFQTNSTPGYYFNSGTPVVPEWVIVGSNAGQWQTNGNDIYYNLGKVGIGGNNPQARLHVFESSPGFTVAFGELVSNWTSSTNLSIGDANGPAVLYLGQSILSKAYLSWETNAATPADAYFQIGTYGGLNPMLLQAAGGNVGIGPGIPTARLHVAKTASINTALFGTPINDFNFGTNVSIGDDATSSIMYIGQSDENKGYLIWNYSNIPVNASFQIGTYSGANPLLLQVAGGNVGIGTTAPGARLDVRANDNGYARLGDNVTTPNYFFHSEVPGSGGAQNAVYAFRTRSAANSGTSYGIYGSNSAIKGYSFWGDLYSFGVTGYNYNNATRNGGVLGAQDGASYWGALAYKTSASTNYGGYFTSYTTGAGKSSQASIGIGIGAWGDLMGADIHGKVYGVFAEGGNYALFANGDVYKNKLDIHLQENSTGTNTVLYTNVSTEVTIQTSGVATLSNGKVSIAFDPSFAAVASSESPVIVTVTPIGNSNGVYLAEVSGKGFTVVENNAGKSSVTVNYIAIAKRIGYEHPALSDEVIDAAYINNISSGLHNDADIETNGEGLYYENGKLAVGIHPSTLSDPNRPSEENVIPKPAAPVQVAINPNSPTGIGESIVVTAPVVNKETPVIETTISGSGKVQPIQQLVPVNNGNKDWNVSKIGSPEVKPDKAK